MTDPANPPNPLDDWDRRASQAQAAAAQAYARLLRPAEDSDSGQPRRVALFALR